MSLAVAGRVAWLEACRRGVRRAVAVGLLVRGRLPGILDGPTDERTGLGPDARTAASAVVLLLRANLDWLAAFIPTAACYLPLRSGITESWAAGVAVTLAATIWLSDRGLSRCDRELRQWFDSNQGRKTE